MEEVKLHTTRFIVIGRSNHGILSYYDFQKMVQGHSI